MYKYFLLALAHLSILVTWAFTEQPVLILMMASLSTFPFMSCAFDVKFKTSLPSLRSQRFSPFFFFPKSVIVFTFYIESGDPF